MTIFRLLQIISLLTCSTERPTPPSSDRNRCILFFFFFGCCFECRFFFFCPSRLRTRLFTLVFMEALECLRELLQIIRYRSRPGAKRIRNVIDVFLILIVDGNRRGKERRSALSLFLFAKVFAATVQQLGWTVCCGDGRRAFCGNGNLRHVDVFHVQRGRAAGLCAESGHHRRSGDWRAGLVRHCDCGLCGGQTNAGRGAAAPPNAAKPRPRRRLRFSKNKSVLFCRNVDCRFVLSPEAERFILFSVEGRFTLR